jgi:DNA-binding winged helix-turn-helix (wHTH) protein/tetratricopeptide (TPR) repeat protein
MTTHGKNSLTLDRCEQRVSRQGQSIELPPKAFALLALLMERRGSLVTKEEILERVWPDTHVSHANVKDNVKLLRRLLGDTVQAPQYIETVRSRGYRYIGDPVSASETDTAPAARPGPRAPIVVTLPLRNLTGSAEYDFVCDGFSEDITRGLSRFRELVVISAHAAFALRDRSNAAAAGELGAEWIVSGGLRAQGTALSLHVELSQAQSARTAWAEAHSVSCAELPRLGRELVRAVVTSVVGQLERHSTPEVEGGSGEQLSAYERLLRARYTLARATRDDVLQARAELAALCESFPSYAPAHVWLAETHYYEAQSSWTPDAAAAAAQVLALGQRAVTLDGYDSMAHLAVAWGYYRTGRGLEMARGQLDIALRLNPNDYNNLCFASVLSVCGGDFERAIRSSRAALRRSPVLPDACLFTLGFAYYYSADYARAVRAFGRMNRPGAVVHGVVAACAAHLGRADEVHSAARAFWAALDPESHSALRGDAARWQAYWDKLFLFRDARHLQRLLSDLSAAGLRAAPEHAHEQRTRAASLRS